MALIIEDGTIVANANTYLTEAEANTILENFGYVLTPATAEADLRTAAQYLESFRNNYQGSKVSSTQSLQWPRTDVYIDCFAFASDEIPEELKFAQALAAYETAQGETLQVNSNGQTITQKTIVGAVSVSYADNGQDSAQKTFNQIDSYLESLFANNGMVKVFRV